MFYLMFAILFSSLFPISFRLADKANTNPKTVVVLNYFFGAFINLIAFFLFLPQNIDYKNILITIIVGIPTGIIYFLGLLLYQKAIKYNGLSIAALFMKLSMIIPIVLSIIFFNERPSLIQYVGIGIAFITIIYLNGGIKQLKGITLTLLLLLFFAGLGDFFNKLFEQLSNNDYTNLFIFFNFITAAIFGLISNYKVVTQNCNIKNFTASLFIGLINALATYFIVASLTKLPISIALVILNITVIIIVSLIGLFFFKEKLSKRQVITFILAITAIILIII